MNKIEILRAACSLLTAYVVRIYPDPGSHNRQHHNINMRQMRRAGYRRLELLQQLRSLTQAPASYPQNLPALLQPNSRESALLPGMRTETVKRKKS
jgi:hypothetical protein